MKNLIITRMNGDTYDLAELGIITKRFRPSSPRLRHETESIGDGEIKFDSYYEARNIDGSFFMFSYYQNTQKCSVMYTGYFKVKRNSM